MLDESLHNFPALRLNKFVPCIYTPSVLLFVCFRCPCTGNQKTASAKNRDGRFPDAFFYVLFRIYVLLEQRHGDLAGTRMFHTVKGRNINDSC